MWFFTLTYLRLYLFYLFIYFLIIFINVTFYLICLSIIIHFVENVNAKWHKMMNRLASMKPHHMLLTCEHQCTTDMAPSPPTWQGGCRLARRDRVVTLSSRDHIESHNTALSQSTHPGHVISCRPLYYPPTDRHGSGSRLALWVRNKAAHGTLRGPRLNSGRRTRQSRATVVYTTSGAMGAVQSDGASTRRPRDGNAPRSGLLLRNLHARGFVRVL